MDKEEVKKRFRDKYFMLVGTIEDGDGVPVRLIGISPSWKSSRSEQYGCRKGEIALLVEWIPAGLVFESSNPTETPNETIDKTRIPLRSKWVIFPLLFEGMRVYYRRGTISLAL